MPSSRLVDLHVVTKAATRIDESGKEVVVRPGRDYGVFKAQVRDYNAALSIEIQADNLISQKGLNPDQVSTATRAHFTLLATFSVTCEKAPEGVVAEKFVEDLVNGDPGEAVAFLVAYAQALSEAEERFRQGGQAPSAPKPLG